MGFGSYLPTWLSSCFRSRTPRPATDLDIHTSTSAPLLRITPSDIHAAQALTIPTYPAAPASIGIVKNLVQMIENIIDTEARNRDALKEFLLVNLTTQAMNLRNIVSAFVLMELFAHPPENPSALSAFLLGEIVCGILQACCSTPYNTEGVREALVAFGFISPANEREAKERLNFLQDKFWVLPTSAVLGVLASLSQVMLTTLSSTWFLKTDTLPMIAIGTAVGLGYLPTSITRAAKAVRLWHCTSEAACSSRCALYGSKVLLYGASTTISLNYSYSAGLFFLNKAFGERLDKLSPWQLFVYANLAGHAFAISQIGIMVNEMPSMFSNKLKSIPSLLLSLLGTCTPPAVLAYGAYAKNGMSASTLGLAFSVFLSSLSLLSAVARTPPVDRAMSHSGLEKIRAFTLTSATGTLAFQRDTTLLREALSAWTDKREILDATEAAVVTADETSAALAEVKSAFAHFLVSLHIKAIYSNPHLSQVEKRALEARYLSPIDAEHSCYTLMQLFEIGMSVTDIINTIEIILGARSADELIEEIAPSMPMLTPVIVDGSSELLTASGAGTGSTITAVAGAHPQISIEMTRTPVPAPASTPFLEVTSDAPGRRASNSDIDAGPASGGAGAMPMPARTSPRFLESGKSPGAI